MDFESLLDSYRLITGAVVDLRQVPPDARLFLSDLALRLAQGQGYGELVGRVLSPTSIVYGGMSPLAPGAQELPAVRVARDLVYRAGVAEGAIVPSPAEQEALPRGLRTARDEQGELKEVAGAPPTLTREQIVTVGESMKLLGITRQAVINAVRAGKVRGEQHGKLWLLSREDVLRYRADRAQRAGRQSRSR
ncbi:MAG: helix-turn-helix domain-containing protein [Myxococcales bacterium]|nr:helix-turn-helix domain-containing protein [Myxococcales bacterium]